MIKNLLSCHRKNEEGNHGIKEGFCCSRKYVKWKGNVKGLHWTTIALAISFFFLLAGGGLVGVASSNQQRDEILHNAGLALSYVSFSTLLGVMLACLFRCEPPPFRQEEIGRVTLV